MLREASKYTVAVTIKLNATRRNTPSCIQLNGVYYISSCLKDNMRQ